MNKSEKPIIVSIDDDIKYGLETKRGLLRYDLLTFQELSKVVKSAAIRTGLPKPVVLRMSGIEIARIGARVGIVRVGRSGRLLHYNGIAQRITLYSTRNHEKWQDLSNTSYANYQAIKEANIEKRKILKELNKCAKRD